MKPRTLAITIALTAMLHLPIAQAQSDISKAISSASVLSGASGLVVAGSLATIAGVSQMTVVAVRIVGESTMLVLRGVGSSVEATVQVSSRMLQDLSVAAGTVVSLVVESVGVALVAGGKLLAFVPNEVGRALIHQARLK